MQFQKIAMGILLGAKRSARQEKSDRNTRHQHFHSPSTPVYSATFDILHELGNSASNDGWDSARIGPCETCGAKPQRNVSRHWRRTYVSLVDNITGHCLGEGVWSAKQMNVQLAIGLVFELTPSHFVLWRTSRRPSKGPLYVSAKRTHFDFAEFLLYHFYLQRLMPFAGAFANGFVLGKRTHFGEIKWGSGSELREELPRKRRRRGSFSQCCAPLIESGHYVDGPDSVCPDRK